MTRRDSERRPAILELQPPMFSDFSFVRCSNNDDFTPRAYIGIHYFQCINGLRQGWLLVLRCTALTLNRYHFYIMRSKDFNIFFFIQYRIVSIITIFEFIRYVL